MTFISLKGAREGTTHKSSVFKRKVVEYLQARGYILTHDSDKDSILPDLILRRSFVDRNRETWVEIKYTDLSLTDKKFLQEIGKYFISYMNKPVELRFVMFIFVRKCVNNSKWKKFFDEAKQTIKNANEFRKSLIDTVSEQEARTIKGYEFDNFLTFLNSISVFEAGYEDLIRQISDIEESKDLNIAKELLEDSPNIINQREIITSNIIKLNVAPKIVYIAKIKPKISTANFYEKANLRELGIFYIDRKKLYSLHAIPATENMLNFIEKDSFEEIQAKDWIEDEEKKKRLLCILIKKYILQRAKSIGCQYADQYNCLYFPHPKADNEEYRKIKNRGVARTFYNQEGEVYFVKHDGIRINIKHFNNQFFVSFTLIQLFSEDGVKLITGQHASNLHKKFTKRFSYNNTELSKLKFWVSLFQLQGKSFLSKDNLFFSKLVTAPCPVTYKGGEKFDTSLLKYFVGEDEDDRI